MHAVTHTATTPHTTPHHYKGGLKHPTWHDTMKILCPLACKKETSFLCMQSSSRYTTHMLTRPHTHTHTHTPTHSACMHANTHSTHAHNHFPLPSTPPFHPLPSHPTQAMMVSCNSINCHISCCNAEWRAGHGLTAGRGSRNGCRGC